MWYVAEAFTSGDLKSIGRIFRVGDPITEDQAKEFFSEPYLRNVLSLKLLVPKRVEPLAPVKPLKTPVVDEDGMTIREAPGLDPNAKLVYPVPMAPEREDRSKPMLIKVVEESRMPLVTAKEEAPHGKRGRKLGK